MHLSLNIYPIGRALMALIHLHNSFNHILYHFGSQVSAGILWGLSVETTGSQQLVRGLGRGEEGASYRPHALYRDRSPCSACNVLVVHLFNHQQHFLELMYCTKVERTIAIMNFVLCVIF